MAKICIVEDDNKIREELTVFLTKNGYEVEALTTFEDMKTNILQSKSDLILLDINLPVVDGYFLCKEIRKESDVPIVIVTSKNTEIDELMSMNLGADDFITKPYNTQILLARIESILKRTSKTSPSLQNIVEYRGVRVNIARSTLEVGEQVIELTKNELKILNYLIEKRGNIVSRDALMTYLWDSEMFVDDNTLTVNINRVRRKLEEFGIDHYIETRRGQGYIVE